MRNKSEIYPYNNNNNNNTDDAYDIYRVPY